MAGSFLSPDGDLEQIFVTDYQMIDQYAMTGSLWGWGINTSGQFGDNTIVNKSSPVQTIAGGTNWKQVALGQSHSATIKTDGSLWLTGDNTYGALGNNTLTSASSPIQTISGGTNWTQVSTGQRLTGAIKTDGTLWLWGDGANGQMGNNTRTSTSSPVQTIAGGNNWKQIAVAQSSVAAIKTDGTLWLWGNNTVAGQLGTNNAVNYSSPVQTIAGGTNWKQVSARFVTVGAIKTDGTLWTWGYNVLGALGNGVDILSYSSPIQTIAGGTNWKQVSVGGDHMAAIKTNGTLWTWGRNTNGQLGDNTVNVHQSSPVQTIAGGTNWKQVSAGGTNIGHTTGIKTDGTLWTWGSNATGQLGDNTIVSKSSPIQTIAGGTNWKQVDAYTSSSMAIYFYDAYNLYPNA